jgi:hypothetical protein
MMPHWSDDIDKSGFVNPLTGHPLIVYDRVNVPWSDHGSLYASFIDTGSWKRHISYECESLVCSDITHTHLVVNTSSKTITENDFVGSDGLTRGLKMTAFDKLVFPFTVNPDTGLVLLDEWYPARTIQDQFYNHAYYDTNVPTTPQHAETSRMIVRHLQRMMWKHHRWQVCTKAKYMRQVQRILTDHINADIATLIMEKLS